MTSLPFFWPRSGALHEQPWLINPYCVVSWQPRARPAHVNIGSGGYGGTPSNIGTIEDEAPLVSGVKTVKYQMNNTWGVPWVISGPVARPVVASSRSSGTDTYHVAGCSTAEFRALFTGVKPWSFALLFRFASASDTSSCLVWNPTSVAIGTGGTHAGSCRGIPGGDYVWGSQRAGVAGANASSPARDTSWHVMCYSFTGSYETLWVDGTSVFAAANTTDVGGTSPASAQLATVTDEASSAVEWGELAIFAGSASAALTQWQVTRLTASMRRRNYT